jgi:hypothetical protein
MRRIGYHCWRESPLFVAIIVFDGVLLQLSGAQPTFIVAK